MELATSGKIDSLYLMFVDLGLILRVYPPVMAQNLHVVCLLVLMANCMRSIKDVHCMNFEFKWHPFIDWSIGNGCA